MKIDIFSGRISFTTKPDFDKDHFDIYQNYGKAQNRDELQIFLSNNGLVH